MYGRKAILCRKAEDTPCCLCCSNVSALPVLLYFVITLLGLHPYTFFVCFKCHCTLICALVNEQEVKWGQSTPLEFSCVDMGLADSKNTTLHIRQKLLLFEREHSSCNVWMINCCLLRLEVTQDFRPLCIKGECPEVLISQFAHNGHGILIEFCHEPGTVTER